MEKRFINTLAVSGLFATLVAGLFYRLAGSSASASAPQLVPVVCATASLAVGAKIRRTDVKLISIPAALRPRDSFSRIEDVVERPVIAAIIQDEPIVKQRLSQLGSGAGLAPMIPAGFRAVSIRVNDVIGVAGYAQPGMRVDVLVTGHPPDSPDTVTRTILQNVLVLSAGQVLQAEPKGQAINATLVTLQVTPQQAEILTLAGDGGHIQLVLRNSSDAGLQASAGTQLSGIYGAPVRPVAVSRPPRTEQKIRTEPAEPIRPAANESVEIIRGSHRSEEPLPSRVQTGNPVQVGSR